MYKRREERSRERRPRMQMGSGGERATVNGTSKRTRLSSRRRESPEKGIVTSLFRDVACSRRSAARETEGPVGGDGKVEAK